MSENFFTSIFPGAFAIFIACVCPMSFVDQAQAQDRAAARSFQRTERTFGATDRLGSDRPGAGVRAAARSRKANSAAVGGRSGGVSGGFEAATGTGRFDEPMALSLSAGSSGSTGKKSKTFRGLRNKQASCIEHDPEDKRFSGKKRVVNAHCDTRRR